MLNTMGGEIYQRKKKIRVRPIGSRGFCEIGKFGSAVDFLYTGNQGHTLNANGYKTGNIHFE